MYSVRIKLPGDLPDQQVVFLCQLFEEEVLSSSSLREKNHKDGDWNLEWLFENKPDLDDLSARMSQHAYIYPDCANALKDSNWSLSELEEKNWLEECYRAFPPFSVGPFYIHGSHYEGEKPAHQTPLEINAATAFGSGEHGTTKGCLEAMLDLKSMGVCPWNTLDMGTGSGILAIAAWKLWQAPIVAADIDQESVEVTKKHAELNGVKLSGSTLTVGQSDGCTSPFVSDKSPYELIIANILAGPLIDMAPELVALMDHNSYLILSGMLHDQVEGVLEHYVGTLGLTEKRRYERGEWSTVVLHKA